MTVPLLEVRGLSVRYGGVRALRGVDLVVGEGEFVVLLGANGAGKTTALRCVSGLLPASAGTVTLAGQDITRAPGERRTALGLGHVPEGRRVFPDQTVLENLLLGAFVHRRDKAAVEQTLAEMFALFPRLADRRAQAAGTLSGGEAQMLAVARALMCRPRLLMLDEPSLGLAPLRVAEMFAYLSRLHRERGLAVLLVEQQAALALRLGDRGYVLENGRMGLEGPAAALAKDDRVQRIYLGGTTTTSDAGTQVAAQDTGGDVVAARAGRARTEPD